MRAAISTFCTWQSYGSVLQSVALKKALLSLGCESYIIRSAPDDPERIRIPGSVRQFINLPFDILHKPLREAAYSKGTEFIAKNLDICDYPDYSAVCLDPPDADIYISGSDQVWQPFSMNPLFFLDFIREKKKVSYAASMGSTKLTEESSRLFKAYLREFSAVSVREQDCADVLRPLTEKEIRVHIDPTFLIPKEEWRRLETEYPVSGKYILLYTIYWNSEMKTRMKELSRKTGLPVYAIKPGLTRAYCNKAFYDVGPGEFLWLIDHAEYVVTTSFHGAAFSTIFKKRFSAIANPSAPSRISHLLRTLEIPFVDINELDTGDPFDYGRIAQRMAAERERGLSYLKDVLI